MLPGSSARVPWAADNHWVDAAVADAGAELGDAPHCVWSEVVPPGRRELTDIAMPCMGLVLGGWTPPPRRRDRDAAAGAGRELNDRAYGQQDRLAPLVAAIVDPRVRTHGVRVNGEWACVAVTVRVGDDVSVQYVATEARHRRQGLAARVVGGALADARADGMRTATLQASPDGRGVYERLGFRTVTMLRASIAGELSPQGSPGPSRRGRRPRPRDRRGSLTSGGVLPVTRRIVTLAGVMSPLRSKPKLPRRPSFTRGRSQLAQDRGARPVRARDRLQDDLRRLRRVQRIAAVRRGRRTRAAKRSRRGVTSSASAATIGRRHVHAAGRAAGVAEQRRGCTRTRRPP